VLAQLVHALNFMQKAINHRRCLFHDFAFDVAIFLVSYIIDERASFLGRQQHVAASDEQFKVGLIREWPHRGVKYHDRLSFCRGDIERCRRSLPSLLDPTAGPQPLRALLAAGQI
jgi:hypothetical protein